ncbi:MAG: PCRF domain-containing protein [Phycisphaerales bacterium]|nr:PCRF domain-containing protein [Phycisphaerales bacterium]
MEDSSLDAILRRRLDDMAARLGELDALLADPGVTADYRRVREISVERAALAPVCERYRRWQRLQSQHEENQTLAQGGADAELAGLAREELPALQAEIDSLWEQLKADLVTSEDRAVGSIILELRAGVGGDEACLWVGDLLDMYRRYAQRRGWRVEDMEFSPGDAGGFRSAVLNVSGEGVWAHLGYEGGTHQVKRVPATEAQGRVHTSTATVAVLPEPEEIELKIDPEEVKVSITTAQGPGGQNVNKVATAVHLIHLPTGIEVRMQESKSQQQNREKAWKLLRARLYERQREQLHRQRDEQRLAMIGSAGRAEKIRTYRYKENLAVDHRINESFNLGRILEGELDSLVKSLIERDTAQRLASLGRAS